MGIISYILWGCTTGPSGTWDMLHEAKPSANMSHVPRGYSDITPLYHEENMIIFSERNNFQKKNLNFFLI